MCQKSKDNGKDQDERRKDNALLNRCRAGNMVAFGQLIERYQNRLFNAVLRMVGNYDDSLEITQEAFYRALKGLKNFRGSSGFYTWLYRIAMNLCINHHRRRQNIKFVSAHPDISGTGHQADALTDWVQASGAGPQKVLQIKEAHERVLTALDTLEPASRSVVILRDIEELSYAQIAKILEIPVGTVKSRLSRARMALREKLGND